MRKIILAALILGCSDDNAQIPNACSGDYDQILGGLCDLLSRCPDLYPLAYSNRVECQAILCWASTCHIGTTSNGTGIDFTLHQVMPSVTPASTQACLDYLRTVSCDQGLAANNPCGNVLGGSTSSGNNNNNDECTSTSCATGSYCLYGGVNLDLGVRTCSTCKTASQVGEACSGGDQCAIGLYCDDHFDTSTFLCASPAPDGTPCFENAPDHSPCQSGFCNFRTDECDPNGNEGDPCVFNADCRQDHCNSMGVCARLHAVGEACSTDADCENFTCDPNAHTCGLVAGSACMPFGGRACAGFCDAMTNLCTSPKPLGSVCTNDVECQSQDCTQTSFAGSTRSCQTRCDDTHPCPTSQVCTGLAFCNAPQPNGSSCLTDGECLSGKCGQNETCIDKPKIGGTCSDSTDCYPIGYCHGGVCATHKFPGAACDAYDSCLVPYICLGGTCKLLNLSCTPAATGEQCTLLHVCDAQSYCDVASNFTCKARFGAGQMCNVAENQCAPGLFCDKGMCAPQLSAGTACMSDSECIGGTYCVMSIASVGVCTAAPAGQPCNSVDTPCPDGWFCMNDKCAAGTQQAGQTCTSFNMGCVAGLSCIGGMCQPKLAIGAQCDFQDENCLSGHCDRTADVCLLSDMCM